MDIAHHRNIACSCLRESRQQITYTNQFVFVRSTQISKVHSVCFIGDFELFDTTGTLKTLELSNHKRLALFRNIKVEPQKHSEMFLGLLSTMLFSPLTERILSGQG